MKVEVVESTSKSCERKGKELVAENEDQLSQDDMDDINEHLTQLGKSFTRLMQNQTERYVGSFRAKVLAGSNFTI
ncbi:hypothetical protein AgCh_009470 [Apium graveolens]